MTIIAFTPSAHRATTGLSLALAVALLSGCGGGGDGSTAQPAVTVTVTPTVTMSAAPPPTTATRAKAARKAGIAKSDVVGRQFDLGTIVRVEEGGGVPVIIFDRWTVRGVADSTLAARGVSMGVHSDSPYQNLNSKITYRIPVAQDAVFTYKHCVAVEQPPVVKSSTLEDFIRLQNPEKTMLLRLDPHGQVISAQNDPAC
jgi:hypothetical protein